jgi:predicted ArsR family transcriptional regulator
MDVLKHSSDVTVLDLLRKAGGMRVDDIARVVGVTATAVRQRLSRLMAAGLVSRTLERAGRGRPSHRYELTEKGRRQTGSNFADLAVALWEEIRAVRDPEIRRGLLQRLSRRFVTMYADRIAGDTVEERMRSLAGLLAERDVPFEVEGVASRPILRAYGCPYIELAEQDRSVCAMERMMFGELIGQDVRLSGCRFDGASCCTFELS